MNWSEIVAAFGGGFDPAHRGHREAVSGLFKNPGIQKVLVLPTASAPHKPTFATTTQRVEMARLTFSDLPQVAIDLREIRRSEQNPSRPSYTYDTLQDLRREIPPVRLAFVIGTDQLVKLATWHRFPEVLDLSHWIVLKRKDESEVQYTETISQWESSSLLVRASDSEWLTRGKSTLKLVTTDAPAISSTEIRETIARSGNPAQNTVLPSVLTYLKQNRLYGSKERT